MQRWGKARDARQRDDHKGGEVEREQRQALSPARLSPPLLQDSSRQLGTRQKVFIRWFPRGIFFGFSLYHL